MPIVNSALSAGATTLHVAQIAGLPSIGAAAVILGELARTCDQVVGHKLACRGLVARAQIILNGLRDGTAGLEGTALQEAADELESILSEVNRRMSKRAKYNMLYAWLKRNEISKDILFTQQQLDGHLAKFNINAQIAIYTEVHSAENVRQRDQEERLEVLDKILNNQEHMQKLLEMHIQGEQSVQQIMEAAQIEFHKQPRDTPRYHIYEKNIFSLYDTIGLMPSLPDLSHEVTKQPGDPVAGGTYSDVWLGTWSGHVPVALKSLREVKVSPGALRRFERDISVWHRLEHPNVLRFLGVVSKLGPHIHIVSPWQSNGNALTYVKNHPMVNRLQLLTGAARGIEYLHSRDKPVVHGNLKCANILVSNKGEALISDFGLSHVVGEITETAVSVTLTSTGSSRWCAPEIMNGITAMPTLASDVYSFAMAIYECLTTERPFAHLRRETTVVIDVVAAKRPPPPPAHIWQKWFTDGLWDLLRNCWSHDHTSRPPISDVRAQLQLHADAWDKVEHTDSP